MVARRRRNKLVLYEWRPSTDSEGRLRRSSAVLQLVSIAAFGAAIYYILAVWGDGMPVRRRWPWTVLCDGLSTGECQAAAIGGWFAAVLAIGMVLKIVRGMVRLLLGGRDS